MSHSRLQGDVAESIAASYFTINGYVVSKPLNHSPYYDLIVDNGQLQRVEVKSSSYLAPSGNYQVALRTLGGNQSWTGKVKHIDSQKTDLIFIATSDFNMYLFDADKLNGRNAVTVRPNMQECLGKFGVIDR